MTKPIEWTTPAKTVTVPGDTLRLDVRYPIWEDGERMGHSWRDATPSDLVAALAAMGEGERAEVLAAFHGDSIVHRHLQEQLEKAERSLADAGLERHGLRFKIEVTERERDDARLRCGAALATAATATARAEKAERECATQRERADQKAAAHSDLAVAHRKALLDLDEARKERDRSNHLRAGMLPDTRRELGALGFEDVAVAARRVVAERDSLRSRLIAAETSAAQREPREYPLAEGSRWEGDEIVESDGMRLSYRRPFVAVYQHGDGVAMKVEARARNLAALLAKRGLL
jgi:hypothetical protein